MFKDYFDLNKPPAASWDGWIAWEEQARSTKPIVFFILETIPDWYFTCKYKVDKIRDIVKCYVKRSHTLESNLPQGKHYAFSHKLLHSMFTSLVDHVECQCSLYENGYDGLNKRSAIEGLKYLNWAQGLVDETTGKPTDQAIEAAKMIELYNWWTVVRPSRPDAHVEVTAWNKELEQKYPNSGIMFFGKTYKEKMHTNKLYARYRAIERKYDAEDTKMMCELVKIQYCID